MSRHEDVCCVCGDAAVSMCQCALRLYCGRECQEYDWRTQKHFTECPSEREQERHIEVGKRNDQHIPEYANPIEGVATKDKVLYTSQGSVFQYRRTASASQAYTKSDTAQFDQINGGVKTAGDSPSKQLGRRSTLPKIRFRPYESSPSMTHEDRMETRITEHRLPEKQFDTVRATYTTPPGIRQGGSYDRADSQLEDHDTEMSENTHHETSAGWVHPNPESDDYRPRYNSVMTEKDSYSVSHAQDSRYMQNHLGKNSKYPHANVVERDSLWNALPALIGQGGTGKKTVGYKVGRKQRLNADINDSSSLSCANLSLEDNARQRRQNETKMDPNPGSGTQIFGSKSAISKDGVTASLHGTEKLDDSSFVCKWKGCGKVCRSIGGLVRHTHHHSDKPRILPFDVNLHPYRCQWNGCSETFKHVSDLNQHAAMHATVTDARLRKSENEIPQTFKCTFKGCGKLCRSVGGLKQHSVVHKSQAQSALNENIDRSKDRTLEGNARRRSFVNTEYHWHNRSSYTSKSTERNLHGSFSNRSMSNSEQYSDGRVFVEGERRRSPNVKNFTRQRSTSYVSPGEGHHLDDSTPNSQHSRRNTLTSLKAVERHSVGHMVRNDDNTTQRYRSESDYTYSDSNRESMEYSAPKQPAWSANYADHKEENHHQVRMEAGYYRRTYGAPAYETVGEAPYESLSYNAADRPRSWHESRALHQTA